MRYWFVVMAVAAIACGGGSPSSPTPVATTPTNPAPTPTPGPTVTSLVVEATSAHLINVGSSLQFIATATMSDGTIRIPTAIASWQSSNTAVATVSSAGVVTALSPGTVTITATYLGRSGSLEVQTALASATRQILIFVFRDPNSNAPFELTFQGAKMNTYGGPLRLNATPGQYELTGWFLRTADAQSSLEVSFQNLAASRTTEDNGIQLGSVRSVAGPSPRASNCSVAYSVGPSVPVGQRQDFRVAFTVTSSRIAGATCPGGIP